MRLCVLLATVGRRTLPRALDSLRHQAWADGDECMVVSDGNHKQVANTLLAYNQHMPIRHLAIKDGPHRDWGHTPRNRTMHLSRADYICHFDDDDVALPNMVDAMRTPLCGGPRVRMFRMIDHKSGRLVWTDRRRLERRHVSTQNIVHPNDPKTFGRWGSFYGGDSQFIIQTAAHYPGRLEWVESTTCVYNPPHDLTANQVLEWYLARGAAPAAAAPEARPDTSGGTTAT